VSRLAFRKGFETQRLVWSAPDAVRSPFCSYCFAGIGEDDVPLMMWRPDGSAAQFCDECARKWIVAAA
jgi:hypothetical protein